MLYVIVGPSGAGKTTFINLALKYNQNCKAIPVDVCSLATRQYEKCSGRRRVSLAEFAQNSEEKRYSAICVYLDGKYGFTIPEDYNREDVSYLLDYPGDYPECLDIKKYCWKGFLILPPSSMILEKRLLECNRIDRIKSAQEEYCECLDDIAKKRLDGSVWSIVINDHISTMQKAICTLIV